MAKPKNNTPVTTSTPTPDPAPQNSETAPTPPAAPQQDAAPDGAPVQGTPETKQSLQERMAAARRKAKEMVEAARKQRDAEIEAAKKETGASTKSRGGKDNASYLIRSGLVSNVSIKPETLLKSVQAKFPEAKLVTVSTLCSDGRATLVALADWANGRAISFDANGQPVVFPYSFDKDGKPVPVETA